MTGDSLTREINAVQRSLAEVARKVFPPVAAAK
jgi:hypothetical protein